MTSIAARSTFMAGSLARTPFRKLVSAAAAAGYDSITVWPNTWRHALDRDGLTLEAMRRMLEDHQLTLAAAEGCKDWAPEPGSITRRKRDVSRTEVFDVCVALGGQHVGASHVTGVVADYDRDIPAFAQLCDDAARHNLRVALEPVGFSALPTLGTVARIVDGAQRSNACYMFDILHHMRGGGTIEELRSLSPQCIELVQLCDGARAAPADLVEEVVYGRRLPGDGEFDIPALLRTLSELGVRAAIGVEVYRRSYELREPVEVMREMLAATRGVFAQAGLEFAPAPRAHS